jgi:hypothetical protein
MRFRRKSKNFTKTLLNLMSIGLGLALNGAKAVGI